MKHGMTVLSCGLLMIFTVATCFAGTPQALEGVPVAETDALPDISVIAEAATIADSAGDVTSSDVRIAQADTTPPDVSLEVDPTEFEGEPVGDGDPLEFDVNVSISVTDSGVGVSSAIFSISDEYGVVETEQDLAGGGGPPGSGPPDGAPSGGDIVLNMTLTLPATVRPGDADGRVYEFSLTGADAAGNISETVTRTVTVTADVLPPEIALNDPDPATITLGEAPVSVQFSGDVADEGSGLASATLTISDEYGEANSTNDVLPLIEEDVFALVLDLPATVQAGDADGRTYTATLTAEDNAGNVADPVSVTVTVLPDLTAPQTTLNVPRPEVVSWSATPASVDLAGSAVDDESGLAAVTLTVADEYGEANSTQDVMPLLEWDGDFELTLSLPATTQVGDADGRVYEITLTASDNAGNAANPITRTFTVEPDTTPPATAIDADPSSLDWSNQPVAVDISGSATDDESGVASANVAIADEYGEADAAHDVTALLQADGGFVLSVDLPATVQAGDADGRVYEITLTASDNAGNEAEPVSTTVTVEPDVQAPAVTLDAPDPAELEGGQGTASVAVSGCVTDDLSGVATAVLAVADQYGEASSEQDVAGILDADGCFELTLDLPTAVRDGDDERVFELTLTATDNAGNEAASGAQTVVVTAPEGGDTTPPRVKLYAPRPSELRGWPIFRPQRVRISGRVVDDESGIASATVAVDDEYNWCDQEQDVTRKIRRNGKFRTNVRLWAWVNFWDWNGRDYEISLSAVDNAGNEAVSDAVVVRSPHPWERFWRRWR